MKNVLVNIAKKNVVSIHAAAAQSGRALSDSDCSDHICVRLPQHPPEDRPPAYISLLTLPAATWSNMDILACLVRGTEGGEPPD